VATGGSLRGSKTSGLEAGLFLYIGARMSGGITPLPLPPSMENIGKTLQIHFVICLSSSVLLAGQQSSSACYLLECIVLLNKYIQTAKFIAYKVYLMCIQNVHSLSLYKTKQ